jgi:GT2 family glycosyltransferase
MVDISVVVPTYRRADALAQTLDALVRLDYPADRFEIIVVDDGSGDDTPNVVHGFQDRGVAVEVLQQPNSGVATARNHGARRAKGALLIFLDDDMIVEQDHLARHIAVQDEYPDCLTNGHWEFSPTTAAALRTTPFGRYRIELEAWVKDGIAKVPIDATKSHPSAVTACDLGILRDTFWALGGFDESFPYAGYEDQEFSHRAAAAGYQFVYDESIRMLHNDQRLSLQTFCERQERGALTAALLAVKFPDAFGSHPLITENTAPSTSDAPLLFAKKVVKRVLSFPPALAACHATIRAAESLRAPDRALRRAYWMLMGVYINRGIRAGLARPDMRPETEIDQCRM